MNFDRTEQEETVDFGMYFDIALNDGEISEEKVLSESYILSQISEISDRYPQRKVLDQGGMKVIYESYDLISGRKIAIASMRKIEDLEAVEHFIHEARLTAALQHPNIIPVHDLSIDSSRRPFFTMKLIEGENLQSILKKIRYKSNDYEKKYGLPELLVIFMKICDAIAYAHSRGVIHLDLKPENIQISDYGEVLVCDWGLAKYTKELPDENLNLDTKQNLKISVTNTGVIKGTPGYMAPEQADSSFGKKSYATDIFSLGAILYSILTLERPYEGSDAYEIVENTLKGALKSPSERSDLIIPASLEAVCLKALSTEPVDRYQKVSEIQNEIAKQQSGFATEAQNAGFHTLVFLLIKRHLAMTSLVLFALVTISIVVSLSLLEIQKQELVVIKAVQKSKTEEKKRLIISKDNARFKYEKAVQEFYEESYLSAYKSASEAIELDPTIKDAHELLAVYHILQMEFKEARLSALDADRDDLHSLAEKYENLKKTSILLLPKDFVQLLNDTKEIELADINLFKMIVSYCVMPYPLEDRIIIARAALRLTNPKISELKLDFMASDKEAKLSLANNHELENIECLKGMQLTELDLSNTKVRDLNSLEGMPLISLNLSNTKVHDIASVIDMPLQMLNLVNTGVSDISPIAGLPLNELYLGEFEVIDIYFVNECHELRYLSLPNGIYAKHVIEVFSADMKVVERP